MSNLAVVNPQIVDAVTITNKIVGGAAANEATAVVRQQVTQSMGLVIQDAVDHLQQLLVLDATVTAKTMTILFSNPEQAPQALAALATIQEAVQKGISELATIGSTASTILAEFPSPS